MLTNNALLGLCRFLGGNFAFARYKAGDAFYDADIHAVDVLDDGRVAISFAIDPADGNAADITEVQLHAQDGTIWAISEEIIRRGEAQEGLLYRFYFTIKEA